MAAARQETSPLPPESKFIIFEDFSGGMDTRSARQNLPEKFAAWMENLQPIAANKLQGVPAPGSALGSLPSTEIIVKQFYFDIGITTDYVMNFTQSGALYAVANSSGVVTQVAPAGTFSASGGDATNWLTQRILIADSVGGFCSWDGLVFVKSGGVSPNIQITNGGSGYTNPTVTRTGGSGSGDTYSVQFRNGVVTGITLLTPGTGFVASDTLTLTINDATGINATANAHVWPTISTAVTTLAVAFGRIWLSGGRTLIVGGTGSSTYGAAYDDFLTADASVTTTISDSDLVHAVTALRYLEGYLYILGDNSVKSIGGISVSSGVTNFTITPLSSDQGTIYPLSVLSYNRLVVFANKVGVFAVFGASVEKISNQMDGIFKALNFINPLVCGVVDLFNIHVLVVLGTYQDPVLGNRAVMMSFFDKKWFLTSQGVGLRSIVTGFVNGQSYLFGSSGHDVTPLLSAMAGAVAWKLQTSLTNRGNPIVEKRAIRAGVAQTLPGGDDDLLFFVDTERGSIQAPITDVVATLIFVNNAGGVLNFTNATGGLLIFTASEEGFVLQHTGEFSQAGRYMGATLTGTVNGVIENAIFLEYQDGPEWRPTGA